MLELPEVLTLSKQADSVLSGKVIKHVFNASKPHKFAFYNGDPMAYGELLAGKVFRSSKGYGMFVDFFFSDHITMNIADGTNVRYYCSGEAVLEKTVK